MIEPEGSSPMATWFTKLIKDELGVTAIEYGLIAALIVIGSLVAVDSVASSLNLSTTFSKVASGL
jgi:pilus assembly protein Flp/PilA